MSSEGMTVHATSARHEKRGFYDQVKIPVMLCWNDDYGNFDNQIRRIDIHEALQLDSHFVDEDGESIGLSCALGTDEDAGSILIGTRKFSYLDRRMWVGNIYWDLVWMYGKDLLEFLNYIQQTKHFDMEEAEHRLFNWWESGKPFDQKALSLIAKFSSTFRL